MQEQPNNSDAATPAIDIRGPRTWQKTSLVEQAQNILRGKSERPKKMLKLAKALKNKEKKFGFARKLLARARSMDVKDPQLRRKLRQQHALCTYKDPDLPAYSRLDMALEILQECENLEETEDQETLGLAGSIFKRKWEVDAQKENLERSLFYYLRGYNLGPQNDQGYTGINAAFILDQIAGLEAAEARQAGTESKTAEERSEQAHEIRSELIDKLPGLINDPDMSWLAQKWWFYATIAEAYFGKGECKKALKWLKQGKAKIENIPIWELQSTATQLATLARIQNRDMSADNFQKSEAARVLAEFLGNSTVAALTAYVGKVGLALSGGGFRASLYHIGVLAKLAELDALRHVEVLSCVSGGSILGAQYYLELRNLFRNKKDSDIKRDDYIACVKNLQTEFLAGVQKNIRTRIAAEFFTNLKMIFYPGYSRTMRAGDLYERFLYSRVADGYRAKTSIWTPWRWYRRWLTDLYITPVDESTEFRPRNDNWRRWAKVPDLILNATTLNTGHNWQFTASWMGEPPGGIDDDIDCNYRLRRMYYWEAPEKYQKVRLGHAVAASACVPGLFEPLSLSKLYPETTVRLVDGGVHDNQGIVGLLEQDCNVLLVSDASGQMDTKDDPGSGVLGVSLRSNSILMSRVRAEQYDDLVARNRSHLLRGLMFIHLKKDLDADPVDWVDCEDPHEASEESKSAASRGVLTRYGIRKNVQRKVAAIRTDLDSFSDAEAFALMTSGYRMTEQAFRDEPSLQGFPVINDQPEKWDFLDVEKAMQAADKSQKLMQLLDVAGKRAFKIWHLSLPLRIFSWILLFVAAIGLIWLFKSYWGTPLIWVKTIGTFVLVAVAGTIFGKWVMRLVRFRDTLLKIGIGVGLAILGPIIVRLHLWVFDRLYLRWGKLKHIVKGFEKQNQGGVKNGNSA